MSLGFSARRWSALAPVPEGMVHRLARLIPAALGEARAQRQKSRKGVGREEVRVQGQDDIGVLKLVLRVGVLAKGSLGRGAGIVQVDRLPLHQLRARVLGLYGLPLRCQRGRGHGFGQKDETVALRQLLDGLRKGGLEAGKVGVDALPGSALNHVLGAVWVVQVQQRGLGKDVRLALGHRMFRVTVDLDRAILPAFDQYRHSARGKRVRGGEVVQLADQQVRRLLDIGVDLLVRLLGASRHAGQGERRAHDLHKAAA